MKHKISFAVLIIALAVLAVQPAFAGVDTANGWYEAQVRPAIHPTGTLT
ncbi:MAG: hypothetical protein P8X95_08305 [Anaerolineales bacterium]